MLQVAYLRRNEKGEMRKEKYRANERKPSLLELLQRVQPIFNEVKGEMKKEKVRASEQESSLLELLQ